MLAVHVYPSAGRPHYLKRAGLERGVYVRVGSTNRHADQELLEELRRFARGETSSARGNPCAFPWSALAQLAILCRRPLETGVDQIVEGHSVGMVRESSIRAKMACPTAEHRKR